MEANEQTTVIGADTHIKGEMTFGANAKILGTCEGRLSGKGEVQIASGANCKAEVEASKIAIDGAVEGNVIATERVQLNANAKMSGDLVANTLVVEGGAQFTGHVKVGPDAVASGGAVSEPKVVTVAAGDKAAVKK